MNHCKCQFLQWDLKSQCVRISTAPNGGGGGGGGGGAG